jgi:hypothetical protein
LALGSDSGAIVAVAGGGGTGVSAGGAGTGVSEGDACSEVSVGGTAVAVGGIGVSLGGAVKVACGVSVGGTSVIVGCGVLVAGAGSVGTGVLVTATLDAGRVQVGGTKAAVSEAISSGLLTCTVGATEFGVGKAGMLQATNSSNKLANNDRYSDLA